VGAYWDRFVFLSRSYVNIDSISLSMNLGATNGTKDVTIQDIAKNANIWIAGGGACIAILSGVISLGMWLGPLKDTPQQLAQISTQLTALNGRLDKGDWAIESLKSRADATASQILVSAEDRSKIWDSVRRSEALALQLKGTTVQREDFIEWGSALGTRNKTLSIPSLGKRE
jgi:hypothetical protein